MKHLTTVENIKAQSTQFADVRFVGDKVNEARITPYIDESEQQNIKHQIGENLFIDLLEYVSADDKSSFPDYSTLLNGGIYQYETVSGSIAKKQIKGLVHALNYYVWARLVKNNNYTVTSFGFMQKKDDYSEHVDLKERLSVQGDTLTLADQYLQECIEYLKTNYKRFPLFKRAYKQNRLDIKVIGD